MRGWPVHRPTHAPATAFRTNSNSAPPLCVVPKLLACERIPLRHRSNLQRKKQHRHSGIFRVADLGPGTMPRGKYPESPAPAGRNGASAAKQLSGMPNSAPQLQPPRLPRRRAGCSHSRACETIPPKPKNPRAVTLWRHACLTTPVVKPPPPQPPSEQTAATPTSTKP